jgi:hypothetical protein
MGGPATAVDGNRWSTQDTVQDQSDAVQISDWTGIALG